MVYHYGSIVPKQTRRCSLPSRGNSTVAGERSFKPLLLRVTSAIIMGIDSNQIRGEENG